jgi:hypothetical protein
MAWLNVSFPSVSTEAEVLFRRGLPCLADALFAERGFRAFFAKTFLAVGFFIESPVNHRFDRATQVSAGVKQLSSL